ncbi:AraC family transcriptional regulator [Dyella sp. BiH032]|uniref:AraC family transcriptional regulator n=1 Tax=Dyella sp. BiH032 TaxID=3075430 RepID=UPI00289326F0|nr:AraC family transcriptional regulator [Dyella sp. BiH032]WNL44865.1 AraC family transcriptional regulator [Dyella sp. BiH032]
MDALSRLIQLAQLQGSLDVRCQFAGGFAVDHDPAAPGEALFHLVLDGDCAIEPAGEATVPLETGDLVIFPRGAAHRIRDRTGRVPAAPIRLEHDGLLPLRRNADGPADLDLLCGRFRYAPASASLLLSTLPATLKVSLRDSAGMDALQALVALMRLEADQRQPGALAVVTALTHALFALALRAHAASDSPQAGLLPLLADPRLGAAVQAMLADPARAWTLEELGRLAAMSRASFARHFGERAGMTPADCLTRLRMQIAADLLLRTRRRTGDIGQDVGYQSEAAFGKAFRHYMGNTPARFRREHGGFEAP